MSSSILRCICQRKVGGNYLRCFLPGIFSSSRMVSTVNSESPIGVPCPSSSSWSPLLILPSDKDSGTAGNKVLIHVGKAAAEKEEFRCASKLVGSSHGWLALFDEKERELSLYNPLSRCGINLPPVPRGYGDVEKVITSCEDPQREDCRAVMRLDAQGQGALAFCCPGRRPTDWTIIGPGEFYKDFVYSGTYKLLFCITENGVGLEGWDLGDPLSPRLDWSVKHHDALRDDSETESDDDDWDAVVWEMVHESCATVTKYLVASQEEKELFLVYRYTTPWAEGKTRKTTGFQVWKIIVENGGSGKITELKLRIRNGYMITGSDFDGLVMFVGGVTHGVAVAGESGGFPEPDSICFSEDKFADDPNHGIFFYPGKFLHVSPTPTRRPIFITPTPATS